jgi:transcriptional regulator with XRE-family HTH domain
MVLIMELEFKTPDELQMILGERLKALRISRSLSQDQVAAKAGVSLKTLSNLELGNGSSVETLLRALKALNAINALEALSPTPTISPLAILKSRKPLRRVRHSATRI